MGIRKVGDHWVIRVGRPKMTAARISQALGLIMLLSGFAFLIASAPYDSYVAAFVGLGLILWGALLLLIMPTKYVKLELLTAASSSLAKSFEEMLHITAFNCKAVYLPPKLLKDHQPSLIFIPANGTETLPKKEDIPEAGAQRTSKGLFLTPPGLALSKLFEKQMRKSFTEINLDQLTRELPKLFEKLEITKTTTVTVEDNNVTIEATNHIFSDLCEETKSLKKTHEAIGYPFSSAIACTLAKSTGKPVTLEKEEQSPDGKTTIIQYEILEE